MDVGTGPESTACATTASLAAHLLVNSVDSVDYGVELVQQWVLLLVVSEVYDPDTYPVPGASIAAWPVDLVGYAVGEVGSSAESI